MSQNYVSKLSPPTKPPVPISMELINRILDLAVDIQQIPAPTFAEKQRAAFVEQHFVKAGLEDIETDETFNVVARRPGGSGPPIMVSAHLDTVFDATTDLTVTRDDKRIAGPGIGDNSLGVAGLIGLVWALDAHNVNLPGDLWLVANVCEEGLGDLKGMRAVMDKLGERMAACIILEGHQFDTLVHHGVGSRRYKITAEAPGGHSWLDFGQTSAIHTLIRVANELTQLQIPEKPKTTFNIGVIEGGTSVNTIAETANLQLDLRSEAAEALQSLIKQVEDLIADFEAGDAAINIKTIGDRPAGRLEPHHLLFRLAERVLTEVGVNDISAKAGSTDANIPLSRGYPAICIGLTQGGNVHRLSEYIDTEPFTRGFDQLVRLTLAASQAFQLANAWR